MSLIMGFNLSDAVVLVGDSMAVKGNARQTGFPKVVRRTAALREYALGFVGDWDDVHTYLSLADQDLEADYISPEWQIKHRRRCFDILQPANWREGDKYEPDMEFLVAASSGLYLVTNRGFTSHIPSFEAIGVGCDIARYLYHHQGYNSAQVQDVVSWAEKVIADIGAVIYVVGPPCNVEIIHKPSPHITRGPGERP